jgi:hypothetical protein
LELCGKRYDFVFKNKFLSPSHISYHITSLLQTSKRKTRSLSEKPLLAITPSAVLSKYEKPSLAFISPLIIIKPLPNAISFISGRYHKKR